MAFLPMKLVKETPVAFLPVKLVEENPGKEDLQWLFFL